ncbi:putative signal-transduction protein with CBS domains [Bosea sp. 62]|uniref:CBS domain-containing protein n=1 Tax=unclassified Bosea (in: a-proteobacteria) TaxID=2653178 RepID=UPI00125A9EA4|nr:MULTISPECIES: CBS domain-containing protein [unclassified Bosea (in: a-proteobacteria)]CAD5291504.1 putative signal-transduction protein with CBS domains [Bosea sp. 21B]CAD5292622.1 putative signal-transduction protein with CBS domains [Bosea sp. 46]CAD5300082.1 putative signal-transduction protein with CBS domains [Bosea sp. 7B]VVT57179.1 putative signal-transduction protein with CBS domains [Bosea sp. EC-HK365B]VXB50539.1 putative signal-transduction protein with CBS domains [Bosea sp. 12
MYVRDVMSTRLVTISPEHSVWHAAQIMLAEHVSGLPVLDDGGALVGLVTEGDLLRRSELGTPLGDGGAPERARAYVQSRSWKVGALMSSPVLTIGEDAPLSKAAMLLGVHRIKRLPDVRDPQLVGIVSRADLLKAIATGGPDAEIRGDEAVRRALHARLAEAGNVLSRQPELHVEAGRVRVAGAMGSPAELEVVRMVVDSVVGSGFKDELTVEKERE